MCGSHAQDDRLARAKRFADTEQKSTSQITDEVRTRLETEDAHGQAGEGGGRERLKPAKVPKACSATGWIAKWEDCRREANLFIQLIGETFQIRHIINISIENLLTGSGRPFQLLNIGEDIQNPPGKCIYKMHCMERRQKTSAAPFCVEHEFDLGKCLHKSPSR